MEESYEEKLTINIDTDIFFGPFYYVNPSSIGGVGGVVNLVKSARVRTIITLL